MVQRRRREPPGARLSAYYRTNRGAGVGCEPQPGVATAASGRTHRTAAFTSPFVLKCLQPLSTQNVPLLVMGGLFSSPVISFSRRTRHANAAKRPVALLLARCHCALTPHGGLRAWSDRRAGVAFWLLSSSQWALQGTRRLSKRWILCVRVWWSNVKQSVFHLPCHRPPLVLRVALQVHAACTMEHPAW